MSGDVDTAELLVVALRAARAAGAQLLAAQRARIEGDDLAVETKSSDSDPVSDADRAAERRILEVVLDRRPDDGVLGEEDEGDREGTTGLRWVVDPLDGTVNYLHHVPQWAVSVAVEDDDGPVVGVVHHPELGETFHALRGGGAWHGHRRLAVVDPPALDRVMATTGLAYDRDVRRGQLADLAGWGGRVRYLRRYGSAALDVAWVAAGRNHAHVEAGLNRWDWLAGGLLVTEAGGRVSHVDAATSSGPRRTLVAAGAGTHDRLVALLTDPPGLS